jgi:hypothetical protein
MPNAANAFFSLLHACNEFELSLIQRKEPAIFDVLGVRASRGRGSLTARLISLAWKGRQALTDCTDYCKKIIGHSGKSND